MSNCYTTFYFELPLPSDEVAESVEIFLETADELAEALQAGESTTELGETIAATVGDVFEDFLEFQELGFEWNFHCHKGQHVVCIAADEFGNVGHAANLIEWLLPDLDIKGAGFEWANYGGGENSGGAFAAVKTDDGIAVDWVNSGQWLQDKLS